MKNLKHFRIDLLIFTTFLVSGCGVNLITATATPELSAPPVEGESSAPPLETSAEEIIIDKNTPTGVCAKDAANDILACFNVYGQPLATLQVPGIGSSDPQGMHIAGALTTGAAIPPVVYRSWEPEQALLISANGKTTTLRKTNAFLALAGVAGQPVLAFTEVAYDGNAPHSYIYAGTLDTLGSTAAFYDLKDDQTGMALMPVAVEAVGEQAQKVWYTYTAWGIGGADLVYPINRGLYVFDLATGQNMQALDTERNFQGISPDNTLVGSISFDFKGDHSMRMTNLVTGQMVNFPLNPSSDRGAGYAVFLIDGKYAAWLEASGSMIAKLPNFQARIRVGDIATGEVVYEVDSTMAAQSLGWERASFMKPVGWLDAQTLVIEARGSDWDTASLVKYELASGSLTILCQGSFAGFAYP
ncbi:MAG: hypothetical protein Q8N39_07400 [Pelolinea sp.]|nr:hypothetical protein [Pelolinea sp.]